MVLAGVQLTRGALGLILSYHTLLTRIASDDQDHLYLVAEDDAVFNKDFVERLQQCVSALEAEDPRWDFLHLGYYDDDCSLAPLEGAGSRFLCRPIQVYGLFGAALKARGARKLLKDLPAKNLYVTDMKDRAALKNTAQQRVSMDHFDRSALLQFHQQAITHALAPQQSQKQMPCQLVFPDDTMAIGSPALPRHNLFPTDGEGVQESEEERQRRLLQNEPIVVYTSLSEREVLLPEIAKRGLALLLILALQMVCIIVILTGGEANFAASKQIPSIGYYIYPNAW
eukprot:s865_g25.t1